MFWGTIHRMILVELLKVFFVSLVGLTSILVVAGVISEGMRNGLSPSQLGMIIPMLIPNLLPYTVPTTTLFATCIVYGRLSADNEILALKAAGSHIIHVVWPALLLGIVTSAVTFGFFADIIPTSAYMLRERGIGDVEELLYTLLRKDGCIKHGKINWEIHINGMQGKKLYNVIFKRKAADGNGFDTIAVAKEAELRVDMAHHQILVDMRQCHISQRDGAQGFVESRIWPVEIPKDFDKKSEKNRANEMTFVELFIFFDKIQNERQSISHEIEIAQSGMNLGGSASYAKEHIEHLLRERLNRDQTLSSIHAEFHMRPALALGCLCFALVGCPVGIWFSKSDYLSAFITCFLPIVTIYYPLMFCMYDMSRAGKVPPWTCIYLADAVLLSAGLFLFRRLARN